MELSCVSKEIEMVDELIIRAWNASTKKVEGIKRLFPYFKEKEKRQSIVLHYEMMIRELEGRMVDQDLKESRKIKAKIVIETNLLEEAEEGLKGTKEL